MGRDGLILAAAAVSLVAGLAGGLWRAGVGTPPPWAAGTAVQSHAFLMVCTFMGTVIAMERAVALKAWWARAVPAATALAAVLLLGGGLETIAAWLVAAASLGFVGVNAVVVRRMPATHTRLLMAAALAWALGSLLYALRIGAGAVVPCWFAFLVVTVVAERLELTRLLPRRPGATTVLLGLVACLLLGALESGVVYGLALAALGAWLLCFDIARRTVRARGLSRYMAVCLLLGHGWLVVGGLAWAATALGGPWRDAALHAVALGFIFNMVFGHAPVILPALARVKLRFGWPFYLPLALLQATLALRLFAPGGISAGAAGNAAAIVAFAATLFASKQAQTSRRP